MDSRVRRWGVPTALVALGMGLLTAATGSAPASASGCRATTRILSHAPTTTLALPGGASARVWDTGHLSNPDAEMRLVAVRVPAGSLTPAVLSSPTLAKAVTPSAMAARDPQAVVVINGQHFNPSIPGIPEKAEIVDGVTRKASSATDFHVAVWDTTKSAALTMDHLSSSVTSARGRIAVGAVNWQTLASSGVSVYTYAWGTRGHSYGPRTVIVTNGVVSGFRSGSAGGGRPGVTQQFLTAKSSSALAALAKLRVGDKVTISYAHSGIQIYDGNWPHHSVGKPSGMLGAGAALVKLGAVHADCSSRNEELRPRSAIVWMRNGDLMVVAVSGRATLAGVRWGGASVHQFADYLRQLGALTAVNLDGGTSTTLLVRKTVGGPLVRLDRSMSEYQRPVADSLAFRA